MAEHLSSDRLYAPSLSETERQHINSCVRCRGERRVAEREGLREALSEPQASYTLGRLIGSGGMGVVYEAKHSVLGTRHAVKLLRIPDPALRARMLREGRLQGRLSHRNIVPIEDVVEISGAPALVMPFIEGCDLASVLSRGPLPEEAALWLSREIVAGVAEIHRARLVHRDIKPSNVLLERTAREAVPRIADFGLAKALGAAELSLQTATGAMMGTAAYAAPEQLRDAAKAGPGADVFALGALIYEIFMGKRAFESFDRDPPPLGGLPPAVASVVASCLSISPEDRPRDAVALLALLPEAPPFDLRPLCAGEREPTSAQTTPPPLVLPQEPDTFLGREGELAAIDERIERGERFLVLIGPGGVGKTRLMLRYGGTRGQGYGGGALWADAGISGLLVSVASGLGIALSAVSPREQLGRALHARGPLLLLIDGPREPDADSIVRAWLEASPGLVVIATSRAPIGEAAAVQLSGLSSRDSAALFVARAASARPGFRPLGDEAEKIARLIARFEGFPLAIELVAARLRVMSLDALLSRADEPLRLAAGGSGRHGAMHEVLVSAIEELSAPLASALSQLSLFAGPFSIAAAEPVVDLSAHPRAPWVPDILQELSSRALLRSEEGDGEVLLKMHPLLREVAEGRLGEDDRRATALRHARHFARHADPSARAELWRSDGVERRSMLADAADILIAADRMIGAGEGNIAADLGAVACLVYEIRGPAPEGVVLFERISAMEITAERRVELSLSGIALLRITAPARALDLARRALEEAETIGSGSLVARAKQLCGISSRETGRTEEAKTFFGELLADRGIGERLRATALRDLAVIDADEGRLEEAQHKLNEVISIAEQRDDARLLATCHLERGFVLDGLSRLEEALEAYEAALAGAAALQDRRGSAIALSNIGWTLMTVGRFREAEERFSLALEEQARLGSLHGQAMAARNLAALAWRRGDLEKGERMTALALRSARQLGAAPVLAGVLLVAAEGALSVPARARAYLDEVLALGCRQENAWLMIASVDLLEGHPEAALSSLERADSTSQAVFVAALRALAYARLGRAAEALPSLDALEVSLSGGGIARDHFCLLSLDRAEVAARVGQGDRAREALEAARRAAEPLEREGVTALRARFAEVMRLVS